ncbi:diguanylate cyclase [Microbacterium trichothecenolyticum]|uniref:diguanylate cyclase n=1 Tax=Microbacterium trichothecenolyticum TaxID=69370 RepID=UPI001C6E78F0|nr:diguanylate cyclase [Microbacterium trichothecenolyticum]MBW9120818.1 diguanylate cyclase [Microbacterium trichothecenolyticum]
MTESIADGWFDHAPCGLIAMSIDGVIRDVNDRFLAWTGHARGDLVDRPIATLVGAGSRRVWEERVAPMMHLRDAVDEVALDLVRADGTTMPALINAAQDGESPLIRMAVFNATERVRYERDLLAARRAAESSQQRVRVLQELSTTFGLTATDEEVARSFAEAARDAFGARETAVLLAGDDGELTLTAGVNPLAGRVAPVPPLRQTEDVTVVTADGVEFPEVAAGLREAGLTSLSVTPLLADGVRQGTLVCFFDGSADFDAEYYDLQRALGRQASQTLVRVRLQRRLAALALHDQLTGVANRQLLQLTLDEALTAAIERGEPLSVLFLDIDEFKSINDAFGHAAGDLVLVELATRLAQSVRAGDVVGRIGGDEFVAVCPGADAEAAAIVAERILSICRAPIPVVEGIVSASVSVGVSVFRPGSDARPGAEQMLMRADAAMYDAKRAGKDRMTLSAAL